MFCHSCGKDVKAGNIFCSNCGTKVSIVFDNNNKALNQSRDLNLCPTGTMILVFALLGVLGIVSCGLLSFFSIPALILSIKEVKKYPLDQRLKTSKVLGIIGVILLVVSILIAIIFIAYNLQDILKSFSQRRFYR